MTDEQLIYWLRGFFELSNEAPTREQWGIIRAHVLGGGSGNLHYSNDKAPEYLNRVLNEGCKTCAPEFSVALPTLDESKLR